MFEHIIIYLFITKNDLPKINTYDIKDLKKRFSANPRFSCPQLTMRPKHPVTDIPESLSSTIDSNLRGDLHLFPQKNSDILPNIARPHKKLKDHASFCFDFRK